MAAGLLGGVLSTVTMLLYLWVYSLARPGEHLGSMAGPGTIIFGCFFTIVGILLGGVAGAVVGMTGFDLRGARRVGLFGAILLATIVLIPDYDGARLSSNPALFFGLEVVSPLIGGAVGGAIVGLFAQKGW